MVQVLLIMQPFQTVLPQHTRRPLCSYFSAHKYELLKEIAEAYRLSRSSSIRGSESIAEQQQQNKQLLALVVSVYLKPQIYDTQNL